MVFVALVFKTDPSTFFQETIVVGVSDNREIATRAIRYYFFQELDVSYTIWDTLKITADHMTIEEMPSRLAHLCEIDDFLYRHNKTQNLTDWKSEFVEDWVNLEYADEYIQDFCEWNSYSIRIDEIPIC